MGVRSGDHLELPFLKIFAKLNLKWSKDSTLSTRHKLQALKYDTSLMGHSFGPWEGLFSA